MCVPNYKFRVRVAGLVVGLELRANLALTQRTEQRDIYFATKVQLRIINLHNQQVKKINKLLDQESGRDFSVFGSTNSCWHMQLAKFKVVVCKVTVLHPTS